jgi:hypothetical protein
MLPTVKGHTLLLEAELKIRLQHTMVLHVGLGRQRRSVQIVARVLHWKNNHRWQSDKAQAETHIMQAREVGGPAWHVAPPATVWSGQVRHACPCPHYTVTTAAQRRILGECRP